MRFGGGGWNDLALALDCNSFASTHWKCTYILSEIGDYISRKTPVFEE